MSRFLDYNIGFTDSFKLDLKLFLPKEDDLFFKFEELVNQLDTSEIEASYSDFGRSAMHPKLILSVIFFGYATGIMSGRKLEQACAEDLKFIYLSKGLRPGKSSINEFRQLHYKHFKPLFLEVVKMCELAEYGDNSISIVDGSKIHANSSKKRTKNLKQLEKWREQLKKDITSLEKEFSESNTIEPDLKESISKKKTSQKK